MVIITLLDVYRALAAFFYRAYAKHCNATGRRPVGVPGNRDPESPCTAFEPRKRKLGDFSDCLTDGHYLCALCCHKQLAAGEGE